MVFKKVARAFGRDLDYEKYNERLRELSAPEDDVYRVIEFEVRFVNGAVKHQGAICSTVLDVARVDGGEHPSKLDFPGSWGIQVGDRVKAYIDVACCCQSEVDSKGEDTGVEHVILRELEETEEPYKLELIRDGHVVGKFLDKDRFEDAKEYATECDEHDYEFPE